MFISAAYAQSSGQVTAAETFFNGALLVAIISLLAWVFVLAAKKLKTYRQPYSATASVGSTQNAVFVSYRRADSIHVAGRLHDRLTSDLGKSAVFKDIDSIPLGADFRHHIDDSLKSCRVFLLVMGKNWQGVSASKSRIDDPDDLIRIEVETALRRSIPVIPILIDGAPMPDVTQLPKSLQGIAYRQAINVRADPDFHRDVDRLVGFLRSHLRMA